MCGHEPLVMQAYCTFFVLAIGFGDVSWLNAFQPISTTKGRGGSWKIKNWVNCGQVANSIFVERESWSDFGQTSKHLGDFCQANRWSQLSPSGTAPSARYRHTSVWSHVADGMYVFGGYGSRGLRVNGPRERRNSSRHSTASLQETIISMTCTFSTARRREGGIWWSWRCLWKDSSAIAWQVWWGLMIWANLS